MTAAAIIRPECEKNYTLFPNVLLSLGKLFNNIKPTQSLVYLYLLSKDENWNIQSSDIAKNLNIGESSARKALTILRENGLVSFQSYKNGGGKWTVAVPDFLLSNSPSEKKPLRQKPLAVVPQAVSDVALETNDLLPKTEKTTNSGLIVVSLPDYINKTDTLISEMSKLDATLQACALKLLTEALLCAGKVKNGATAYLIGIVRNLSKNPTLPSPKETSNPDGMRGEPQKPVAKVALINLENELNNIKKLYKLNPNPALLSQIKTLEEKLNAAKRGAVL